VLKCNECKEKGDKTPTDSTATMFEVHTSCVSKWKKQADHLRQALQSPDRQMPGHAYHVSDEHPSAKRILLGRERHKGASMWPLAEEFVYREYKRRRQRGLRVTHHSILILMRINLKKYYGEDVSKEFKCSKRWLNRFKGHWGISSRCRTEKKNEPMELKLPRVRRVACASPPAFEAGRTAASDVETGGSLRTG